jgi:glutaminyl-tRNA synthetase
MCFLRSIQNIGGYSGLSKVSSVICILGFEGFAEMSSFSFPDLVLRLRAMVFFSGWYTFSIRLKHAYIIKCVDVVKDAQTGEITEVHCTYDPDTISGGPASGRKVKGTLHWVSAAYAIDAEVRLYDYLMLDQKEDIDEEGDDFISRLNPNSLIKLSGCKLEPSLALAKPGDRFQVLRQGYFCADTVDWSDSKPVFNRIVSLKDTWAKISKKE